MNATWILLIVLLVFIIFAGGFFIIKFLINKKNNPKSVKKNPEQTKQEEFQKTIQKPNFQNANLKNDKNENDKNDFLKESNVTDKSENQILESFENNKKIWLHNTKKTVLIKEYNYFEIYDKFPFLSDYLQTREYLEKKGYSSKLIEKIITELQNLESDVLSVWQANQQKLLKAFDSLNVEIFPEMLSYLLQYYNYFLDEFKNIVIDFEANKIIPFVINLNLKDVFEKSKKKQKKKININAEDIKKIIEDIQKNVDQKTQNIIDNLFNEFSHNKSNFERSFEQKYKSQYNQQKTNFQKDFDQVTHYYKILEIDQTASASQIKKAYLKMVLKYHPDNNVETGSQEKMIEVNNAYDFIKKIKKLK